MRYIEIGLYPVPSVFENTLVELRKSSSNLEQMPAITA
jgi:hypothetical protein